jgi:hypothetical protein
VDEAKREQVASIEAARLATAAARMMEATARAALTLDRLRNGRPADRGGAARRRRRWRSGGGGGRGGGRRDRWARGDDRVGW